MVGKFVEGVGISGVGEDFAGGKGEEIGTAVPLLSLLVPFVVTASADDRFEVHPQTLKHPGEVMGVADSGYFAIVYGDMDSLVLVVPEDQRFEDHTFVVVQKGEYHIEVDK